MGRADKSTLDSLKRDAAWRLKPCSLRQLNMLRRMQETYNLKYAEKLAGDKLDLSADALEMTNGQVGSIPSSSVLKLSTDESVPFPVFSYPIFCKSFLRD